MTRLCWLLSLLPLAAGMMVVSTALAASGTKTSLANDGSTRYVVVVAPNASATVRHAARELASDLHLISGAHFAITTRRPTGPAIYVGSGAALRAAFPKLRLSTLPGEGFVIQTAGGNLALAGKDDRGTLYGVYSFLEDQLGVRWYSPHDTLIPHRARITLPPLHERRKPAFTYRDMCEYLVLQHSRWDAHLKLNGIHVPKRADLGGTNRLFNGAEDFYALVPPAKYFAQHPEYFSLIDGKRSDQQFSQLSLVNPAVFRIITAALVAQAKADPHLLVLGLSPNDSAGGNSQGARSLASDARYGAPSGTLLHFVNKVAVAVQRQLPGRKIWVETLAYQYTEKPPRPDTIQAGNNVLVCFAPVYMNYTCPIDAPQNHSTLKDLLGWDRVAPGHLQVWTYVTNFSNYLQPFPDWDELGADMELYYSHGVSGMYCEGNYNSVSPMMAMRVWVLAHLMWNPRRNVWQLIKEFSDGYYGPAGPYICRYLRLLHRQLQKPNMNLTISDSPNATYLTPALLNKADRLFQKAEVAVRLNAAELRRVKEARLGLLYVELMRSAPKGKATAKERAVFQNKVHHFVRKLPQFGVKYIREGVPVSRWLEKVEGQAGTGPK